MRSLLVCISLVLLAPTARAQDPEANKEVVRRFLQEVAGGRIEVIDETHHPEFRFEGLGRDGGIEEHKAVNRDLHTKWADMELTIDQMVAEGDVVMGRFTVAATYKGGIDGASEGATGERISWQTYFDFHFRDGRIIENYWMRDEVAVRRQLGIGSEAGGAQ